MLISLVAVIFVNLVFLENPAFAKDACVDCHKQYQKQPNSISPSGVPIILGAEHLAEIKGASHKKLLGELLPGGILTKDGGLRPDWEVNLKAVYDLLLDRGMTDFDVNSAMSRLALWADPSYTKTIDNVDFTKAVVYYVGGLAEARKDSLRVQHAAAAVLGNIILRRARPKSQSTVYREGKEVKRQGHVPALVAIDELDKIWRRNIEYFMADQHLWDIILKSIVEVADHNESSEVSRRALTWLRANVVSLTP